MTEPEITPTLIADHGISENEYAQILRLLNRAPTFTELGIFSAMWNEHCSYKSSKKWLRTLPTTGPQVICGPGENAGIVDIGDGQALVFKMESHNHPSYIEPYQGAATGVGGILRDVFTMGARPIAAMNALSFGSPDHPKTAHLVKGVVAGIGGYGNCFGVPTVGGEVRFHPAYNGNCLVNAFAAGLVQTDKIFYSAASGVGMPVVYLGAKTGRDGVGGATMASAEFDDTIEEKRPTVQVGDPFTEKRLMEATLELMATGAVISIQDMGAAGLTCSAVEMGDKGDLGIRLDLEKVPVREDGMTAYEMMLSESQERMLMVLRPEKEADAKAVFDKWDLDFAIVGETIDEDRFLIQLDGAVKADLPLKALSGSAPEYDRPWVETPPAAAMAPVPEVEPIDGAEGADRQPQLRLETLGVRTIRHSGHGRHPAHAGPGRRRRAGPRHPESDCLHLGCHAPLRARQPGTGRPAGRRRSLPQPHLPWAPGPWPVTDNLNFGNPEKPEIMGQFVGAIQGIGAACAALDMPIVSGNVSLYNETDGQAILPTPTIGAVGLIDDHTRMIGGLAQEGDVLLLLGETRGHMGQSALLAEMFGREEGDAPPVDLAAERAHGDFVRDNAAQIHACTDLSDGGLALAVFELAEAASMGASIDTADTADLFAEDQGRYLIACAPAAAKTLLSAALPIRQIGGMGGDHLSFGGARAPLADLVALYRTSFAGRVV